MAHAIDAPIRRDTIAGDYFTEPQAAAYLEINPQTLRRWAALNAGPPITRVGRRVLYRKQGVVDWLLKQEHAA